MWIFSYLDPSESGHLRHFCQNTENHENLENYQVLCHRTMIFVKVDTSDLIVTWFGNILPEMTELTKSAVVSGVTGLWLDRTRENTVLWKTRFYSFGSFDSFGRIVYALRWHFDSFNRNVSIWLFSSEMSKFDCFIRNVSIECPRAVIKQRISVNFVFLLILRHFRDERVCWGAIVTKRSLRKHRRPLCTPLLQHWRHAHRWLGHGGGTR